MRGRNDESYAEFVRASYDRLRRSAYLMTGDLDRAEDIVQDALIRVYRRWPRLERSGGLPTYVRRALTSAAIDQSRRSWRRETPVDDTAHQVMTGDATSHVDARDAVVGALRALPPRQRACVVLRHLDELSVAETADALGCSEGNVKSQTARALAHLRQLLGPGLLDDDPSGDHPTSTGRNLS